MARTNLPSPRRTVRRGVRICQRLDYTEDEALLVIARVAQSAANTILGMGEYDTTWIMDVHDEAIRQLRKLPRGEQ